MKKISKQQDKICYVVSACLAGVPCRWNKKSKENSLALNKFLKGEAILLCPEIMGGLTTPRPACEIVGGDGTDVLSGRAKVIDKHGKNYTKTFVKGAQMALSTVKRYNIKKGILKSGSPTCGVNVIYKGDFSGKKKKGSGIFAVLLQKHNIKITEV